jgi:hypothetical protein
MSDVTLRCALMPMRCPSDLRLELYLAVPELRATRGVARHVTACASCLARLARMRRLGDEFHREVFPATFHRVVAAAPPVEEPGAVALGSHDLGHRSWGAYLNIANALV